jgi:hypothetical protein
MPLKLRSYGFLEPAARAGSRFSRARLRGALVILFLGAVSAAAGYAVGTSTRVVSPAVTPPVVSVLASADAAIVSTLAPPAAADDAVTRTELVALKTENERLTEELRAYEALQDKTLGVGREVSVAPITVRHASAGAGWKFFALISGGVAPNAPFRGNAVIELAGSAGGEDERVLSDVPVKTIALDYRTGQIISGELAAAGAPARALRVLVVDEAGRTRATQRVALP